MSGRRRPLYARMLRLRHLKLRPAVAFLLFEGSIGLGVLLALADIVNGWGIVAVPVTVAVMVKLNDIVAGGLAQVAHVAPVGVPPPVASGEAAVPPQNRATQPGRGASMRRTRGIVGRARLGSARGIVYVHPTPADARRSGPSNLDSATGHAPAAPGETPGRPDLPKGRPPTSTRSGTSDAPPGSAETHDPAADPATTEDGDVPRGPGGQSERINPDRSSERPYPDRNKGRFA